VKPAEVRNQIKARATGPLYLLEGADLQSQQELAQEFAGVVEEGLEAFNVNSFHANQATSGATRDQLIGSILADARTLPMMVPRRVILVHAAEALLSPRKAKDDETEAAPAPAPKKGRQRSLTPVEELEQYFEQPEPTTTLVFVAGPLEANRRLVKLARKHAVVVDCGSIQSAADAARWIQKRLEKEGQTIEPKAVSRLLATTDLNLGRIRSELEKVTLYTAGEPVITDRHVAEVITPNEDPSDGPAVGMAILSGNAKRALLELGALLDAGTSYLPVLGQIRWAAGQLRPDTRVKRALDLILDADINLKSSMGEPRFVLERLVIELCGRG
jgi:DNA polymerase III delta subunit